MGIHSVSAVSGELQSGQANNEPIAIIGIGCKLPGGVDGPDSFWDLVSSKKSGIKEVPADRWKADNFYSPNKEQVASAVSKWAGFVDDLKSFDAKAFGISPREAASMDPQQRLLLEAVREAVQDSSLALADFTNSHTGVFVGISQSDYKLIQEMRLSNNEIFAGTGYALCINANRISHRFGLTGPSFAVDTACSSSMVALNQACLSIKDGACDMAVACGVNVIAHPIPFVAFSKAGMLSETGVLSTFDANANGYVRGEGVGAVLLKKLSAAQKDGDEIYAVIEGTCVNQDGYTTTLTAPNQSAQISMLEELCDQSGITADQIGFVEAHGTGTPVGDPIEAGAIGEAIGKKRHTGPLYVGSVKANIGHLESAAGISGLIKAAISIKKRQIAPNINFKKPNPNIPMDVLNIQVPTTLKEFPTHNDRCFAVVNSFGFGGTNASALLSSPPQLSSIEPTITSETPRSDASLIEYRLCVISSHDQASLQQLATALITTISKNPILKSSSLGSVAASITQKYRGGNYRAAVVASSKKELLSGLRQIAKDKINAPKKAVGPFVFTGEVKPGSKIAFVYTGQGSQWWAMARQFIQHNKVFAETLNSFDEHFSAHSGWSIKAELLKPEDESRIDDTTVTQPALFAIQAGMSAVWKEAGINPDMVLGHSIGEAAAMFVAGGLSMKSAAEFLNKRGTIRDELNARGAMAAIAMDADQVELMLEDEHELCVAAINAPGSTTISGDNTKIDDFIERFENDYPGIFIRKLAVDTAWHSHHLDNGKEWFDRNMNELDWSTPAIPFISTVTAKPETCFDKAYGWQNLRQPVNLKGGIEAACELGATIFVEVGPHSTLVGPIQNTCSDLGHPASVLHSLDRKLPDELSFMTAKAKLAIAGAEISADRSEASSEQTGALPAVPWNKEEYWKDSEESRQMIDVNPLHPLLGMRVLGPTPQWKSEINLDANRYFEDHRLQADRLFPAAGYLEIIFAAGKYVHGDLPLEITDTQIREALFIGKGEDIIIHTTFDVERNICRLFSHVRDAELDDWVLRAQGVVRPCDVQAPQPYNFRRSQKGQRKIPVTKLYDVGESDSFVNYGPAFQTVRDMWMTDTRTSARIEMSDAILDGFESYLAHPTLVDGCLQITDPRMTLELINKTRSVEDPAYLPVGANIIRLFKPVPPEIYVHAEQYSAEKGDDAQGGFLVTDIKGEPVLQILGLKNRKLPGRKADTSSDSTEASTVIEEFTQIQLPETKSKPKGKTNNLGHWVIFGVDDKFCSGLENTIRSLGGKVTIINNENRDEPKAHWIADELEALFSESAVTGIVYAWGIKDQRLGKNPKSKKLVSTVESKVCDIISLAQALDELQDRENLPSLTVITKDARRVSTSASHSISGLANASQVAVARTISSELHQYAVNQIDIDDTQMTASSVCKVLFAKQSETELIVREDRLYAPRLKSVQLNDLPNRRITLAKKDTARNFQVTMKSPGILENLDLYECDLDPLVSGEVQLEISTVGLNFRDIMAATGLLPREAEAIPAWQTLGLEFGAVISKVGPNVKGLKKGDHVMGMAKSCLTRYLNLPANAVTKIPKTISLTQAATIPSAFATAYYALSRVGNLRKGESILIHVATGGVGLAAIQIAKRIGAEIFATAGSDAKRKYLRKLGIKHVMNSRSLDFADEVMEITDGKGVDVILNSLPDAYIQKGLDILAPYGRFLEIGKRDVYANSAIGMKTLRKNVSFSVLDLAAMGEERPELMAEMFLELVDMFRKKHLTPLPSTKFGIEDVSDAFKFMSQAKHIGKVVVGFDSDEFRVLENREKKFELDKDGTYLVTGGSRGFGVTIGDWLSESGAGKVILASRTGKVDAEFTSVVDQMRSRGTQVISVGVDITDEAAVAELIAKQSSRKRPIKGVIHSAAVIEDALISQLNEGLVSRVIRPKVAGAWNLALALQAQNISPGFFINFSSVAQLLGSTGQANYVAANAFLDGFAHYFSNSNLNIRTIDWGVLGESGFVTRNDSLESFLESVGMSGITNAQACGALEASIRSATPSFLFAALDWQKIARANPVLGNSPRVAPLLVHSDSTSSQLRAELFGLDIADRTERMKDFLANELSNVLKVDPAQIPFSRPMTEMGLDSLSAFELKNRIEGELNMQVPISKFLQAPTIDELSLVVSTEIEKLAIAEKLKLTEQESKSGSSSTAQASTRGIALSDRQAGLLHASVGILNTKVGVETYFNRISLTFDTPVDQTRLQAALQKTGKRHRFISATLNADANNGGALLTISDEAPQVINLAEGETAGLPDLAKGELFQLAMRANEGGTEIHLSAHSAILDQWSLHAVAAEIITVLAGMKPAKRSSRKRVDMLIASRSFNPENPVSSGHRSFWHYASNPIPGQTLIPDRRRPISNVSKGSAPGPAECINIEFGLQPPMPRQELIRYCLQQMGDAIIDTFKNRKPITINLKLDNRDPGNSVDGAIGAFDGEYPFGYSPDPIAGKHVERALNACEHHREFDLYSFTEQFGEQIAKKRAALNQFTMAFRDEFQLHPFEQMLKSGEFSIGGQTGRPIDLKISAIKSDIEIEILASSSMVQAKLYYDTKVVDRELAMELSKLMGKQENLLAAE